MGEILDQLVRYSEVHFMSGQLLMHLCSYPHFDEHVLHHDRMAETLGAIAARRGAARRGAARRGAGEQSLALDEAQHLLAMLSQHIVSRDQQFSACYPDWTRQAGDLPAGGPPR